VVINLYCKICILGSEFMVRNVLGLMKLHPKYSQKATTPLLQLNVKTQHL